MKKWVVSLAAAIVWLSTSIPGHATGAWALVSLKEREFNTKEIINKVKTKGEEDWDKLTTRKDRIVSLDCTHALYLLGGTDALKAVIASIKAPLTIVSTCDDMKRLGIFFEQVKVSMERKQLLMNAPADEDYVKKNGRGEITAVAAGRGHIRQSIPAGRPQCPEKERRFAEEEVVSV